LKTGRSAEKKLACSSVARAACHAVLNNVLPDPQECLGKDLRVDDRVSKHGGRMNICLRAAFLDVERARDVIDRLDSSEVLPVWKMKTVVLTDIGVLRRVVVPVDGTLLRAADPGDVAEPCDRCALVEELLLGQVTQAKELPPRRLILPTMPVQ